MPANIFSFCIAALVRLLRTTRHLNSLRATRANATCVRARAAAQLTFFFFFFTQDHYPFPVWTRLPARDRRAGPAHTALHLPLAHLLLFTPQLSPLLPSHLCQAATLPSQWPSWFASSHPFLDLRAPKDNCPSFLPSSPSPALHLLPPFPSHTHARAPHHTHGPPHPLTGCPYGFCAATHTKALHFHYRTGSRQTRTTGMGHSDPPFTCLPPQPSPPPRLQVPHSSLTTRPWTDHHPAPHPPPVGPLPAHTLYCCAATTPHTTHLYAFQPNLPSKPPPPPPR